MPDDTPLDRVAEAVRLSTGCAGRHLYEFRAGELCYGLADGDDQSRVPEASRVTLSQLRDPHVEFLYDLSSPIRHALTIRWEPAGAETGCVAGEGTLDGSELDLAAASEAVKRALARAPTRPTSAVVFRERAAGAWRECWEAWQLESFHPHTGHYALPRFVDVPVRSPNDGRRIADEVLDWWPATVTLERRRHLQEHGAFMIPWKSLGGMLHTADLLWRMREDAEGAAAVFVGAFLEGVLRDLPEAWRGATWRMLELMRQGTRAALAARELPDWHHLHREHLPVPFSHRIGEITRPRHPGDIARLAFQQAILSQTVHQLVRVIHDDRGLRVVT